MKKINSLYFITSLILSLSLNSCAQTVIPVKNNLNTAISNFKNDKLLKNAGICFYAIDVNTGEVLAELNPDMALAPASTQKLFTTATALEVLGPDFRFKTKIEYVGKIDSASKTLNGFVIIKGGGDPTLGSKYFAETRNETFFYKWIDALKKEGVVKISGGIIADARVFGHDIVPPAWAWEDMGNYFGAGANGLSVMDNIYTLTYNTGTKVGDTCIISDIYPKIDGLQIDNTVTAANIKSDNSYIFGAPYTYFRYIRGELPVGRTKYTVKGSMPDPALFTAQMFKQKLEKHGIIVDKAASSFRLSPEYAKTDNQVHTIISELKSPSLAQIIRVTNYRSVNLYAEHLLCQIGVKQKKQPSTKFAAKLVTEFWKNKGMDVGGLSINDGSGLSRYNTITAKQMVFLLEYMKTKSKNSELFRASLPIAGKEGTVRYLCKGTSAEGNMRLKSGSIRFISAYAGYLTTKSGREVAFFINVNNYLGEGSVVRRKMGTVLTALSDFDF